MADPSAPLTRTFKANVAAVSAGSDLETDVAEVPFAGTVTAVRYIPSTVLTGADTNSRNVVVVDKGGAGSGTTIVASTSFTSGVNAAADTPASIALSGTPANLVVAAGDVLVVQSNHVGTGLADPGGLVEIDIARNDS